MPIITVNILLTTYNQKKYIGKAIEGILAQKTNFLWQLIISDDGSTDGTREICEKYQQKHPDKIRLLAKDKNCGRFRNLAKLMKVANAQYLAICAGDDEWIDEKKLQKQVEFLDSHPDYAICYTRYREKNERTGKEIIKPTKKEVGQESETDIHNFLKRWRIASSSMLFRGASFQDFPYHQYKYLEDTHLVYYSMMRGKGKILNFVGTLYRIHDNNVYGNKDELKQAIINQKVFGDLATIFPNDKVLTKRFNYLNFIIAQNYDQQRNWQERDRYLQQLTSFQPGILLKFNYKFYGLLQRIFRYN